MKASDIVTANGLLAELKRLKYGQEQHRKSRPEDLHRHLSFGHEWTSGAFGVSLLNRNAAIIHEGIRLAIDGAVMQVETELNALGVTEFQTREGA